MGSASLQLDLGRTAADRRIGQPAFIPTIDPITHPAAAGTGKRLLHPGAGPDDYHRTGRFDRGANDSSQMRQQIGELNTTYRQDRRKAALASIPRSSGLPPRKSCQSRSIEYTDT